MNNSPTSKMFTARYNTWVGMDNGGVKTHTPPSSHPDPLLHSRSLQTRRNKKGASKRRRYGSVGFTEGGGPGEEEGSLGRPPSRSVSLEEMVKTPRTVPEKLSFRQLEKFEGELVGWLAGWLDGWLAGWMASWMDG